MFKRLSDLEECDTTDWRKAERLDTADIGVLSTEIDFSASTETCEMILEGDYSNQDIDNLTLLLRKHLKQKAPLDTLPAIIPEADVTKKFWVWPEKTSTSPSGQPMVRIRSFKNDKSSLEKRPFLPSMEKSC